MEKENKVDGNSRRKFIKIAAATAYVAPLIASMPAYATFKKSGSPKVTKRYTSYKKPIFKKVQPKRSNVFSKFRKTTKSRKRLW